MTTGRVHFHGASPHAGACHVSNGEQIVTVGADGSYELPWEQGRHRFAFVIAPDGWIAEGRWWHTDETIGAGAIPPFEIRPARTAHSDAPFAALHVTDFHLAHTPEPGPDGIIADYPTEARLRDALGQILDAAGPVDFVIATGDLTNSGDDQSLQAVARILRSLPMPVFPIFGGHDGNVERRANGVNCYNVVKWSRHIAPPYYSWHWRGRHFISFISEKSSYLDPVTREMHDAFVARDLELFGRDLPVTVCAHKHPYPWNEAIFHRYRVDSWLHGHFHCPRSTRMRQIRVFATSPPAFGGLDSAVAPARIVRFTADAPPAAPILMPAFVHNTRQDDEAIETVWETAAGRWAPLATPAVHGDSIYCGIIDHASASNGGVISFDSARAAVTWETALNGSVEAPIAVVGDILIASTHDGCVHALRRSDGRVLWRYVMPEGYDRWIYAPALIVDGKIIVGTTSCLVCLDAATGEQRWIFRHPRKTSDAFGQFQSAAVSDGKIFLTGYRTGSYLFDLASGRILHANDDQLNRYAARVADNGDAYVIGDNTGDLSCFNTRDGALRWRSRLSPNMITSAFVPFLGGLLGGTAEGLVHCSASDGGVLARRSFGTDLANFVGYRDRASSCPATPCVDTDGESAFVASGDGYLNIVRGPQLDVVARLPLDAPIISGLATTQHGIVGVTVTGEMYCFRRRQRESEARVVPSQLSTETIT
jgi:outer membrane protein assembly factor BamB